MTDVFLRQLYEQRTEWPRGTKFSCRFHTLKKGDDNVWTVRDRAGEPVHQCPVVDGLYESPHDLQSDLDRLIDRRGRAPLRE